MKKIFAFSLAEALITLLIVCLITLASIPVLTKKKRDQNNYATGTWMCTKRSDGKYVTWYSGAPSGDAKDPETWKVSKYSDKCEFSPPQNARNFGLTLIGGGGGGADGQIEQKVYIDGALDFNHVVDEHNAGNYKLAVVGGGGGGHGSDDKDNDWDKMNVGVGGQGGGGAYWIGTIKLEARDSVTASVGRGGDAGSDGGKKCKHAHKPNLAETTTSVTINDSLVIRAGGGQGGQSTRNKGGDDPDCGDGGQGGQLSFESDFDKYLVYSEKSATLGSYGRKNANCRWKKYFSQDKCKGTDFPKKIGTTTDWYGLNYTSLLTYLQKDGDNRPCYGFQNGVSLSGFLNNQDGIFYGTGGFGCRYGESSGFNGSPGTAKLWQNLLSAGEGGNASSLTFYTLPVIRGKLTVEIGDGGSNNENGRPTYVRLYRNSGELDRELRSTYGLAGKNKEAVVSETADGDIGQNSEWSSELGGGQVGKCTPTKRTRTSGNGKMKVPVIGDDGTPECELLVCNMRVAGKETSQNSSSSIDCPYNGTTNPKGFCVACFDDSNSNKCQYTWNQEDGTYVPVPGTRSYDYETFFLQEKVYKYVGDPVTTEKTYSDLFYNSIATSDYRFTNYVDNGDPAFLDPNDPNSNACDCLKYKTETITYKNGESKIDKYASCEDSKKGTYFGAGGGGGSASNEVGIYGKGGAGAPGAVIIQW